MTTKNGNEVSPAKIIQPGLLLLVHQKPAHGYELIQKINGLNFDDVIEPATIYRHLRRMEKKGLLKSDWETSGPGPARRLYKITGKGVDALNDAVVRIEQQKKKLEHFLLRAKNEANWEATRMKRNPDSFKIIHAGALRKPMKECIHLLKEKYPDLKVELEYAGSRTCARAVAEGKIVDVIALADYKVFNQILIPRFVDTSFVFATDQMVLAFDEFSVDSDKINEHNWMDILLEGDWLKYGRSDHRQDPCGYRTLMLWQLAEKYYDRPGLYAALEEKWSDMFPKSIDLAAALIQGKVDYGFMYRSVARQMGLNYIRFPREINLSDPRLADYYAQAEVNIEDCYPAMDTMDAKICGAPIEFAVAIPRNSNLKDIAREFVELLTGPEGEKILEQNGLIPC